MKCKLEIFEAGTSKHVKAYDKDGDVVAQPISSVWNDASFAVTGDGWVLPEIWVDSKDENGH